MNILVFLSLNHFCFKFPLMFQMLLSFIAYNPGWLEFMKYRVPSGLMAGEDVRMPCFL